MNADEIMTKFNWNPRPKPNPTRRAELRRDVDEITIAVTFKWARPWALDHCEAGVLVGDLRRLIANHYGDPEWVQLAGVLAVETWDAAEERHVGGANLECRFERES